jgi:hypothetical protein
MVRIIAYACLSISVALAAVYGYTTGNTEAMGVLRALGWAAVAFVGGCCPAWFFAHIEDKNYGRAVFTGIVALICAGVTLNGSIGGIAGTGDKYAGVGHRMSSISLRSSARSLQIRCSAPELCDAVVRFSPDVQELSGALTLRQRVYADFAGVLARIGAAESQRNAK